MAISAQRFKILDKETNVSIAEFTSKLDSGIMNSAENALKEANETLNNLIESGQQSASEVLEKIGSPQAHIASAMEAGQQKAGELLDEAGKMYDSAKSAVGNAIGDAVSAAQEQLKNISEPFKDVTRSVKGVISQVQDLASLPSKLDAEIGNILSSGLAGIGIDGFGNVGGRINPGLSKSLTGLMRNCRTRGSNYGFPGKPYDISAKCNGRDISLGKGSGASGRQGCDAGEYGNLLNRLTDGAYDASFKNLNAALKSLMALAGYGYNIGLCGVFSALSGNLPKDALSRAAGGLLATFGASGNTNAVLDIAQSSLGLYPKLQNPSIVSTFLSNFTKPEQTRTADLPGLADRVFGGTELLDSSWSTSSYDSIPSLSQIWDYTPDLKETTKAKLTDRVVPDLDFAPSNDDDFLFGSLLMA